MNKKALFAGAASAVLAAIPMVGAFADLTRTDTITMTIEKGCSFEATASDGVNADFVLGQGQAKTDIEGVTFTTTCNDTNTGTWTLMAHGEDGAKMQGSAGSISSVASPKLDGTASEWAFRLEVSGDAKVEDTYGSYTQIPAAATKVASNASTAATGNGTVKAYYGVSASADQAEGTYTGHVVYTLTNVPSD